MGTNGRFSHSLREVFFFGLFVFTCAVDYLMQQKL